LLLVMMPFVFLLRRPKASAGGGDVPVVHLD
jgi:hypothetical protein